MADITAVHTLAKKYIRCRYNDSKKHHIEITCRNKFLELVSNVKSGTKLNFEFLCKTVKFLPILTLTWSKSILGFLGICIRMGKSVSKNMVKNYIDHTGSNGKPFSEQVEDIIKFHKLQR